ncbi:uncharacterized protein [Epargyreus clarus]|uniref:uncharacterized protein n=1 Tax=Epargyreus clarus TaxID=520877 RepID=UPI003C2DC063
MSVKINFDICCVEGCKNTYMVSECEFYKFPIAKNIKRRKLWIAAINMKNADGLPWYPLPHHRICSDHFVGGKKSENENSPSYIPTIFPVRHQNDKSNLPNPVNLCESEASNSIQNAEITQSESSKPESLPQGNGNKMAAITKMVADVEANMAADKDKMDAQGNMAASDATQAEKKKDSGPVQLDKFKRRLIRAVARMIQEKKPENEMWNELKKVIGCDCKMLWQHMRALTIKKLKRLLPADDLLAKITKVARFTATDWLLFDLILVHEKINVISLSDPDNTEEIYQEEGQCLHDLFELVNTHHVEYLSGEDLVEAWIRVTLEYNSRGRQCSPMLLQRRWYQLKQVSRTRFYNFWFSYRGNARVLYQIQHLKPTELQTAIAHRYNNIVTQKFQDWETLIKERRVILSEEFTMHRARHKAEKGRDENETELEFIEPQVETIDLGVESDSGAVDSDDDKGSKDEQNNSEDKESEKETSETADIMNSDDAATLKKISRSDFTLVKSEPDDEVLELDGLSDVETMHIPHEETEESCEKSTTETSNDDKIEDEITLPKITSVMGNIVKTEESNPEDEVNEILKQKVDEQKATLEASINTDEQTKESEPVLCDSDDDMDEILANKANLMNIEITQIKSECHIEKESNLEKSNENIVEVEPEPTATSNEEILGDSDDEMDRILQEKAAQFRNNEVPQNTEEVPQIINVSGSTTDENRDVNEDEDIIRIQENAVKKEHEYEEFDVTFEDNGIEFEDDGIEFEEHSNVEKAIKIEVTSDEEEANEKTDDNPKIDLKLLMDPTVYTMKLDQMEVFQFTDFYHVNDKRVIECAVTESKPVDKQAIRAEDIDKFRSQLLMDNETDGQNDEDNNETSYEDVYRVKSTSWLLQKPKNRSYNPIQLCKNPDFNTRLKRLTAGFLSSTRNRFFLKECKPLTIDLHKAFESKLVDGTLYLKGGDFKSAKSGVEYINNQATVVPSVIPGQDMIFSDNITNESNDSSERRHKIDDQEAILSQSHLKAPVSQKYVPNERRKVINLPDIDQVRRTNQSLLTAEVTPIRIDSNTNGTNSKPPDNGTTPTLIEPARTEPAIVEPTVEMPEVTPDAPIVQVKKEPPDLNLRKETNKTNPIQTEPEKRVNKTISAKDLMANKINDQIINICNQISEVETNELPTVNVDKTVFSQPEVVKKTKGRKSTKTGDAPPKTTPTYRPSYVPLFQNNISWTPKHPKNYLDDTLLTFGTLQKMLNLFKGDKAKQKQYVKPNDKHDSQHDPQNDSQTVESSEACDNNELTIRRRKRVAYKKKMDSTNPMPATEPQQEPRKKIRKSRAQPTKKYRGYFCCWAREKIMTYGCNIKIGPHPCLKFSCSCCCRNELNKVNTYKQLKVAPKLKESANNSTIVLSDDDNSNTSFENTIAPHVVSNPNAQKIRVTSTFHVTTDKAKDSSDILPAVESGNTNVNQNRTIKITSPQNEAQPMKKCKTVIRAGPRIEPVDVTKQQNDAAALAENAKRMLILNSRHIISKPLKTPIYLGKNKVLLCSIKRPQPVLTPSELPNGVRFILMPNGELTVSIDPGVQLDTDQLNALPGLMAIIQQQLIKDLPNANIQQEATSISSKETNLLKVNLDPSNTSVETQDVSIQADFPIDSDLDETSQDKVTSEASEKVVESSNNSDNPTILSNTNENQEGTTNRDSNEVNVENAEDISSVNASKSVGLNTEVPSDKSIEELQINNSNVQTEQQTTDTEIGANNQVDASQNTETVLPSAEVSATDNQVSVDKDSANTENSRPRKTILSDLMEMSGISAEDSVVSEPVVFCPLPPNIIPVTRKPESPVTTLNPPTAPTSCDILPENLTIVGPYSNLLGFEPNTSINRLLNYVGNVMPEMNAVTSFLELKYAYEHGGKFFKLDTVTGSIVPINVCIKKSDKPQGSLEPKEFIDLTDDGDDVICTEEDSEAPNSDKAEHDITFQVKSLPDSEKSNKVKPIKLFKSVRPSIFDHSGKSLLKTRKIGSTRTFRIKMHSRKQELQIPQGNKEPVLTEEPTDQPEVPAQALDDSYDSSDDEPLAKKCKRINPADDKCDTPEYLDLESSDDDMYGNPEVAEIGEDMDMDSNSMDIEGINPELNPVAFEEGSESEDDMCILGV